MNDVIIPLLGSRGDKYLVKLGSIDNSILPDELQEQMGGIELVDITLERISGNNKTSISLLSEISKNIGDFLLSHENVMLYFYCDDIHEIVNRRNMKVAPQKYRSLLFSIMFNRYVSTKNISNLINNPIEIKVDRDIYIHIISQRKHLKYVSLLKKAIINISTKDNP